MKHDVLGGLLGLWFPNARPSDLAGWALAVFVGTYILIFLEHYIHRTMAALAGASVVMVLGLLTPS